MTNIMIIDDDVDVLEDVKSALSSAGMHVETRDTVDGAMEAIVASRPDLLVLDVMFPENPSGGFDLARALRQTPGMGDLPIILLTAINQEFPMDFSRDDADENWFPVQDLIEKPLNIDALTSRIHELVRSR